MEKVTFPFQLPRRDYDRLKEIAKKEEIPAAQIVRTALRRELVRATEQEARQWTPTVA
jgi:hypothetical protein